MPCKIDVSEVKLKLQKYSVFSEAFLKFFDKILGEDNLLSKKKTRFLELPEVARYGYKNYATLGFVALYSEIKKTAERTRRWKVF